MKIWLLIEDEKISIFCDQENISEGTEYNVEDIDLLIKDFKKVDYVMTNLKNDKIVNLDHKSLSSNEKKTLLSHYLNKEEKILYVKNNSFASFVYFNNPLFILIQKLRKKYNPKIFSAKQLIRKIAEKNPDKAIQLEICGNTMWGCLKNDEFVFFSGHHENTIEQYFTSYNMDSYENKIKIDLKDLKLKQQDSLRAPYKFSKVNPYRYLVSSLVLLAFSTSAFFSQGTQKDQDLLNSEIEELKKSIATIEEIRSQKNKDKNTYKEELIFLGRVFGNHEMIQIKRLRYSSNIFRIEGDINKAIEISEWKSKLDSFPGEITMLKDPFDVFQTSGESYQKFEFIWNME